MKKFTDYVRINDLAHNIDKLSTKLDINPYNILEAANDPDEFLRSIDPKSVTPEPNEKFWKSIGGKKASKKPATDDLARALVAVKDAARKIEDPKISNKLMQMAKNIVNLSIGARGGKSAAYSQHRQQASKAYDQESPFEKTRQIGAERKEIESKVKELEKQREKMLSAKKGEILSGMETLPPGKERRNIQKQRKELKKQGYSDEEIDKIAPLPMTPSQAEKYAKKQAKSHPELADLEGEFKGQKSKLTGAKRRHATAKKKLPGLKIKKPFPTKAAEKTYSYPMLGPGKSGKFHRVRTDVGKELEKSGLEYGGDPEFPNPPRKGDVELVPMQSSPSRKGYMSPEDLKKRVQFLKDIEAAKGQSGEVAAKTPEELEKELSSVLPSEEERLRKMGVDPHYRDDIYKQMPPWKRRLVDLQRKAVGSMPR